MNGHEAAKLFRQLAERLERNPAEEFSGAYLVIPPGEAEPLDGMSLKSKPDPVGFWSAVQGAVELAIADFQEAARKGQGFRR